MEHLRVNSTLKPFEPAFMFEFERQFQPGPNLIWFYNNWQLSIVFSVLYVVLVFGGRRLMQSRQPFDLRLPLAVWSAALAAFSWMGMIRFATGTFSILRTHGLDATICNPVLFKGMAGFWLWIFTLSKLPELIDTAFIVLRKQNLIFLHWYHHITVLMYSWYSYPQTVALAGSFCLMNFTVHSLMYSYYAIKASRLLRIPNWVGLVITTLQITQMLVGCVVNGYAYWKIRNGGYCSTNEQNMTVSSVMYFSYLVLFLNFFIGRYLSKPGSDGKRKDLNKNGSSLQEKKGL
ncbi:elongation of very long chain fatty acids protein 6-like [Asterias rubens]|uniref:elongation of very long chain fatty acids protein 6-like n=1 Tax=Asterias rubens TaxID=7604 RepID=UPI0014558C68|nr:elongation of very long chain fatty acids protein 6-like [Asterias rubens]